MQKSKIKKFLFVKKIIATFLVLICFFFILSLFWWQNFLLPVNPNNKETKIFVIKPGDGISLIAENLHQENLIKSPLGFKILVKILGMAKNIQAGDFRLSSSMTAKTIAQELNHGTLDMWVTIPEGLRIEEIAGIINSKFKIPALPAGGQSSKFIEAAKPNEGFLFPDTYLIPKNADGEMIIKTMIDNFNRKVGKLIDLKKGYRNEIKFNNLSLSELITLASLIEREAKYEEDRPKVASVLYNRLEIGMKLDLDATVQYALASVKCNLLTDGQSTKCDWWPKNLTREDLKIDSPYNTYIYNELPKTPICNPGLSSIKAALFPEKTDFLFYVSDKKGKIHPAKNINEQNQNIKKFLSDE